MYRHLFVSALTLAAAAGLQGQAPSIAGDLKQSWTSVKNNILRSAEKMPEENLAFKPSEDVRTWGQLLAHIADANYMICSAAKGETAPASGIEKSKTSQADIVAALKESMAYCDGAVDALTDANAAQPVKMFGRERTRAGALMLNTLHDMEHYGNLVTYMRIKGIVPPSSEGRPAQKKK